MQDKALNLLAAPQGFEPRYAAPEAAVLPLNEGATPSVCQPGGQLTSELRLIPQLNQLVHHNDFPNFGQTLQAVFVYALYFLFAHICSPHCFWCQISISSFSGMFCQPLLDGLGVVHTQIVQNKKYLLFAAADESFHEFDTTLTNRPHPEHTNCRYPRLRRTLSFSVLACSSISWR